MSRGQIRLDETVNAAPEIVFSFLTDLDRSPEWDPTVTRVTQMTRGPLRHGAILRGTLEVDGQAHHADDEVTDYEPPWRFGLRSVQGGTDSIGYSLSEEDDGSTHLAVVLAYELPDLPPDSSQDAAAVRQQLTDGLARSLGRLKALIERETA